MKQTRVSSQPIDPGTGTRGEVQIVNFVPGGRSGLLYDLGLPSNLAKGESAKRLRGLRCCGIVKEMGQHMARETHSMWTHANAPPSLVINSLPPRTAATREKSKQGQLERVKQRLD